MWTFFILLGVLLIGKLLKDNSQRNSKIALEGGMKKKYGILLNNLMSGHPKVKIVQESPNWIRIGISQIGYATTFDIVKHYGNEVGIKWKDNNPIFGERKLEWVFPEYENQDKITLRILRDIKSHQQNLMNFISEPSGRIQTLSTLNQFVPFNNVNGIIPGVTEYSDILKHFGSPDNIEISNSGTRILRYNNGFSFIINEGNNVTPPFIDCIIVVHPFDGITPNGIHLGLSKTDTLKICNSNFHVRYESKDSNIYLYSKTKNSKDSFQIWFKNDELFRMKIFPE